MAQPVQMRAHAVPVSQGELEVHCWQGSSSASQLTVVTVHPWASLGGSEHNCVGIAKALAAAGVRALTFDLQSSSLLWGVVTGHGSEVDQVVAVCEWAAATFGGQVLLLGSSAGAPMAGSALDACRVVVGLATIGYTFGWMSSIAFGSHFSSVLQSQKPKLFIMGEADEFTSVEQLQGMTATLM
eukprot:TRINITY_DN35185_c0_g1_i2.p1 TRINITY_DN35185_c0_g1~~TRINITY_DN35185_c0_g1_i2.p1  ORF type:complete len:184 (+),score=47.16 TRINITY_DN35185_c0_g1_i2:52-603(+)